VSKLNVNFIHDYDGAKLVSQLAVPSTYKNISNLEGKYKVSTRMETKQGKGLGARLNNTWWRLYIDKVFDGGKAFHHFVNLSFHCLLMLLSTSTGSR